MSGAILTYLAIALSVFGAPATVSDGGPLCTEVNPSVPYGIVIDYADLSGMPDPDGLGRRIGGVGSWCRITLDTTTWQEADPYVRCTLLAHEYGHSVIYDFDPVTPGRQPHSPDRNSVMYPVQDVPFQPCATPAVDRIAFPPARPRGADRRAHRQRLAERHLRRTLRRQHRAKRLRYHREVRRR